MKSFFVYKSPRIYLQGAGVLESLGEYLAEFGRRAFIISGKKSLQAVRQDLETSLTKNRVELKGVENSVYLCTDSKSEGIAKEARSSKPDVIIGAGGGSATDMAKLVAYKLKLPIAIIPTISSTAAPTAAVSVVYNDDGTFNRYQFYPTNPDLVLVDTSILVKAPIRYFVAGMGESLSIFFEARSHKSTSSITLAGGLATQGAYTFTQLIWNNLKKHGYQARIAAQLHQVTPSVELIIETNTLLAGIGNESGGLSGSHAIHNGLVSAGAVSLHSKKGRHALHGEIVGFCVIGQLVLEATPMEEIYGVIEFSHSVGLPITLEDLAGDVSDEILMQACKLACEEETMHTLSVPVSPERVYASLKTLDELGKNWKELKKPRL